MEQLSLKLEFGPDGTIRTPYQDGTEQVASTILGAEVLRVTRASNVEWEELANGERGWSVRAAHDNSLAARYATQEGKKTVILSREGEITLFILRRDALDWELAHFFDILPPKE